MTSGRAVGPSRREEYAEATRRAIVEAARQLFGGRGYFATRVDDIATLARVAPATVYAVSGGKQGLLHILMEKWSEAPTVAAALVGIHELDDPAAILRLLAASCRNIEEEFGDILRVLLVAAPTDPAVAQSLAVATARYRQAFMPIGQRLAELRALKDGIDLNQVADVCWFYMAHASFSTLHDDNGWSYGRAELWLYEEMSRALLRN